jgi:hypothetical protein
VYPIFSAISKIRIAIVTLKSRFVGSRFGFWAALLGYFSAIVDKVEADLQGRDSN